MTPYGVTTSPQANRIESLHAFGGGEYWVVYFSTWFCLYWLLLMSCKELRYFRGVRSGMSYPRMSTPSMSTPKMSTPKTSMEQNIRVWQLFCRFASYVYLKWSVSVTYQCLLPVEHSLLLSSSGRIILLFHNNQVLQGEGGREGGREGRREGRRRMQWKQTDHLVFRQLCVLTLGGLKG